MLTFSTAKHKPELTKFCREPIELTRRRKRQHGGDKDLPNARNGGWCFIPPQPFKKPVMLNRSQPDLIRHVLSTVSDVTSSMVKRVAGSTRPINTGK